jgi:hypothetical protein
MESGKLFHSAHFGKGQGKIEVVAGYSELFRRFRRNPQFRKAFLFFFEDQIDLADKGHEFLQVLLTRCHVCQLLQTFTLIGHSGKIITADRLPAAWTASQTRKQSRCKSQSCAQQPPRSYFRP